MKVGRQSFTVFIFTLLTLVNGSASGAGIYKWLEPGGVTHYAETPPESGFASLEVLDAAIPGSLPSTPKSYQSALDVADSIETSRLERERTRLEKRKLWLQERQLTQSRQHAQQQPDVVDAQRHTYYPPRYRYPRLPYRPVPIPHGDRDDTNRGGTTARTYLNR